MATYIDHVTLSPDGLEGLHKSPDYITAFKTAAQKIGVDVRDLFWTVGAYCAVVVFNAQDDEAATYMMLSLASIANVLTRNFLAPKAAPPATDQEKPPPP